jgi:hypothetical protein
MNPENDSDLRHRFAAQRRADHTEAPAWNPALLHTARSQPSFRLPRWLALAGAAAACLLISFSFVHLQTAPNLVTALPGLFETPAEPLFASLEPTFSTPSDFLFPSHLTLQLP